MVMDWTRTNFLDSGELPVVSTQITNIEEGTPLEWTTDAGYSINKVQPSAGASANAFFAGVAMHQYTVPTVFVQVDTGTVPSASPYTFTLTYSPNSPGSTTMLVINNTASLDMTYNASVGAGQYKVVGSLATFNVAQAGISFTAYYKYNITVAAAQALVGNGVVGSSAEQVLQSVGCIKIGNIYTSMFDTSQDWTVNNITGIVAVANGIFSLTGTGAAVTGNVIAQPTTDYPYLGLSLKQ
jgi:hypothetical protein